LGIDGEHIIAEEQNPEFCPELTDVFVRWEQWGQAKMAKLPSETAPA
jgi:hypothetical protein